VWLTVVLSGFLDAPEVVRLLDLRKPVGVLIVAVLHHISEAENPVGLLARLTAPFVSGSHLVISHGTEDGAPAMSRAAEVYRRAGIELTLRSRGQIAALFGPSSSSLPASSASGSGTPTPRAPGSQTVRSPPRTTVPPLSRPSSAGRTSSPTGANRIAASSASGGGS
jgi:hypothetical protein